MKSFEQSYEAERALSDEHKIEGGAKHTKGGRLEVTEEQIGEAKKEMGAAKQSRKEKLWEAQGLESDRAKVLNQLEEVLRSTVKGLNETGWAGENLELPDNLRVEIEKIVKDTMSDPMAGRCRRIRDLLNGKYLHLGGADIRKYRNLLNDENLEKYFDEVENIKSIREQKHWLEKIQIE